MKKLIAVVFGGMILSAVCIGQTRHPNYGGGHHTHSHGGHYSSGSGSSHRGGHYRNSKSANTYGRHKK
jgi:hypothetical protein